MEPTEGLPFRRARSNDQKELRRDRILDASMRLLEQHAYREISVAHIASEARVAKGTVFLYFASKEEVFIALLERELASWGSELQEMLPLTPIDADGLVSLLARTLLSCEVLINLLALSTTLLEENITATAAQRYKSVLHERLVMLGKRLDRSVQGMEAGDSARFLIDCTVLVAGLYGPTHPAPAVSTVLATGDYPLFSYDLERDFIRLATALLKGAVR